MKNPPTQTPDFSAARAAIESIVQRYARIARDKVNFLDMVPLFTPDGQFELPDGTPVPSNEISRVVQGEEAQYIRHHLTTFDVEFTSESTASVVSHFFAITNEASPDHWGEWNDHFEKTEEGLWLIKYRRVTVDGAAPGGWLSRMY